MYPIKKWSGKRWTFRDKFNEFVRPWIFANRVVDGLDWFYPSSSYYYYFIYLIVTPYNKRDMIWAMDIFIKKWKHKEIANQLSNKAFSLSLWFYFVYLNFELICQKKNFLFELNQSQKEKRVKKTVLNKWIIRLLAFK